MDSYRITLPELVLIQTGCKSFEDLASLSGETCTKLAASVEHLDVPVPLHDLNLLLAYIADEKPKRSERAAKAKLIRILKKRGQVKTQH